uniref:Uncharacterized protein n=1 Tax=Physcomitrium patens TaxID=3218 RepID=A0A2K1KDY7_PHYPA|nr:hypothetical protein PHYPA_008367 [Physcomitrium patens]
MITCSKRAATFIIFKLKRVAWCGPGLQRSTGCSDHDVFTLSICEFSLICGFVFDIQRCVLIWTRAM